jgi:hypothetical protein
MELLYSYMVGWAGLNVNLSARELTYQTGFAYMRRRVTLPLTSIASMSASAIAPSVVVKTTDGRAEDLCWERG